MIISDERYASAYRGADGAEHLFDDPGDLLSAAIEAGALEDAEVWVHDFDTKEWLGAESAFYVVGGEGFVSPMGWGIVAYADKTDAEASADDSRGRVVAWKDLVGMARSGDLEPGAGHGTGPISDGAGNQGGDQ
ncbi:MAG: nitrous oxide reductase accessory protein NosL [Acidimicrobiia bacterium]|nr:nitrous oxide reductase accessory protein NosL [Acidimicrobiia bacterium]